jgi:hypothetical protein
MDSAQGSYGSCAAMAKVLQHLLVLFVVHLREDLLKPAPDKLYPRRDRVTDKTEGAKLMPAELDLEELSKYFLWSSSDLDEIQECRGAVNNLGFTIQLCSLRWLRA